MGLYDRDYYREERRGGFGGGGGGIGAGLIRFLNMSFPLGTYLGIRVRMHISFPIIIGLFLLGEATKDGGEPLRMLEFMLMLFGSVLLHEFGHCLACRYVGGTANDILMWPLGGLAMCVPPRRPWPEFLTVVWGPMVNVILCFVCWGALFALTGNPHSISFNPLMPRILVGMDLPGILLFELFYVNYILLLFNLAMIFYPFDGGRLVQIALWWKLGYLKSMVLATRFGMFGAVAVGIFGLVVGHFMLVFIAVFGYIACAQQARVIRHMSPADVHEDQFAASLRPQQPSARERRKMEAQQKKLQREAAQQQAMEQQLDKILEKISHEGMGALTEKEKKLLQKASETKRR